MCKHNVFYLIYSSHLADIFKLMYLIIISGKGKSDVLGIIPFGSIVGAVCTCLGVGLFCGTLYTALDITLRGIFEDLFLFRVSW